MTRRAARRWASPTRTVLLAAALGLLAAALAPPRPADAHPLGNFSVNHVTTVRISDDRVELHYLLDQAEIPTVQERGLTGSRLLDRKRLEVLTGLQLTADGKRAALEPAGRGSVTFPAGAGGLPTSRFEFRLSAPVESPRSVRLRDTTFEERVGWRAIVAAPGHGTAVRTDVPSGDPTDGLRRYPESLLTSPLDRRDATFTVRPGDGTLTAPTREDGEPVTVTPAEGASSRPVREGGAPATPGERPGGEPAAGERRGREATGEPAAGERRGGEAAGEPAAFERPGGDGGFAGLFERASAGEGVLLLLLFAAFGWGALHALSPGHGKAMVAAYLVGTHGRPRHAVALGATVTVTHTIGVFALGLVTLVLSQYVLPEDLYPWLNLASGLLVVAIGAGVLRSRVRHAKQHHHGHDHHRPHHPQPHHHHGVTRRGLLGMGAAAGLVPCPSALVVLLAAVSQHEVALGMLLIVAFSLGLAGTLTALGLAVVYARRLVPRLKLPRLAAALPAASALAIVGVGCVLTVNAVPEVSL